MRKETTEYDYDWALHSLFSAGAKMGSATKKEKQKLFLRAPQKKDMLELFFAMGEPGTIFQKAFAKYLEDILMAHEQGKKLALTSFCQSPAIFRAMDIVPIVLEPITVVGTLSGYPCMDDFMDYCVETGFTETSCSAQRGALGAYLKGLAQMPDFVVVDTPGVCDTNANAFAFTASYLDIPFFQINYPPTLSGKRSCAYHRKDFRNMISFLEYQTKKTMDIEKLRAVTMEMQKQDELICEIQEFQRLIPCPVPGLFNLFIYGSRFTIGGLASCTRLLESMLDMVKDNARHKRSGLLGGVEKKRGLFLYIDHFGANSPMWRFFDDLGIVHLGSSLNRFFQQNAFYAREHEGYTINTADMDSMIDSLADANSRMPMVKQIRGPYDAPEMWLDEVLRLTELLNADFCVYSGTPGCRNTWGMVKLLASDLEKAGLPTLILNCDAFDERVESWGATAHRLEEFLELRRLI